MSDQFEMYRKYVINLLDNLPGEIVAEAGEQEEIMLPSEDGVKLQTWLYFPKGIEGPYPTIAVRCCYDMQDEMLRLKAAAFNARGFAFAIQWCRGTHQSEGIWEPNVNERKDGLSFMQMLQEDARVESVGYWGDSYLALTGWCMADVVPDKVKTMYLGVYGCFRHVSAYKDGCFRQDILTAWAMGNAGQPVTADYMESASYRPQIEVDEKLWGVRLNWYRDWISHTDGDDPYWDEGFWGMMKAIPSKVKIPVYVREGWYDHHLGSAICSWNALSEEVRSMSTLEIGPWNHMYMPCLDHQTIDSLVDNSMSAPLLWFKKILVEKEIPTEQVRLFEIGGDRWEEYAAFPVPGSRTERLFLQAGDRSLTSKAGKESQKAEFTYDPADPVISFGAESTFQTMAANGSHLQAAPGSRADIVTFISEPLANDLHVNGEMEVKLYVASDAEDTAFTAKVMEVFDDGEAYNVRGSITTLAYRNDQPHRITYTPGEIVPITICMWAIDWKFCAGSRIRLDISSSDFPQYSVHSNQVGIWSLHTETKKAEQTILSGEAYPSCVILPVVEY